MLIIDEILISQEIFTEKFICDLKKCKGACCIEGDSGAPVEPQELEILEKEFDNYKDYLTKEGLESIKNKGFAQYDTEDKMYKTTLNDDGPCSYINYDHGVAVCGIEKAFLDGKTSFRKPISCHLYPIRVSNIGDLKAINYEEWSICKDACELGKSLSVPVYKFLKEPIQRAFGDAFYEALDSEAAHYTS